MGDYILKKSDKSKLDEVFGVEFRDFYDSNKRLLAWMWVGLTQFKNAIPKINQMRGLRLRKENIQIGGEDSLQKLFKEDRGNSYFIGEVFAVSKELIPNSQRDYFNENPERALLEKILRQFFNDELHKIYYNGSAVNSAHNKINAYATKAAEFKEKDEKSSFVNEDHRNAELDKVFAAKKEAENARERIEKVKEKAEGMMVRVIDRIEKEHPPKAINNAFSEIVSEPKKILRRTDKLSSYNKNDRKLISKIFEIIVSATDSKTAEMIISKIEDGLS